MNKKQILLIGGGGHCKSCIEVIESTAEFEIAGIVDLKSKIGKEILGYKFIACDDDLPKLKDKYDYALITVGQIKSATVRIKLFEKAKLQLVAFENQCLKRRVEEDRDPVDSPYSPYSYCVSSSYY